MSTTRDGHIVRVLALDGGGVRGLSSLLILRELMNRLALRRGQKVVRPCDCFDLIIGTGTGGISALFLGRLGMTVDEAIREYIGLAENAFKAKPTHMFRSQKSLLDGAVLEERIGHVVERILHDRDATLSPSPNDPTQCRTAVLAATNGTADAPPYIFRSYTDGIRPASTFTIREVARATASTAGLFEPIALGNPPITFIDAGVAGYNNPAEVGLQEAERLWPERTVGCYVSLGTGLQRIVSLGSGMVEACRAIVENCEQVHDRLLRSLQVGIPYFRFNVDRGLDGVDIMEWDAAGPRGTLSGITDSYMRWKEVDRKLNACVRAINGEERTGMPPVPLVSSDTNDETRDSRKYFATLNPPPQIFHGRQEDIEGAVTLMQLARVARIAILGAGGMGKTSIALTVLHDARIKEKFKENRRFISCEGIVSVSSLIDVTCTAFGLHTQSANRREDLLVHLKVAYTSHPALLILDNFETVWDNEDSQSEAEQYLHDLTSVETLSLVLTMRGAEHPHGIRWSSTLHVRSLDSDAARSTFLDVCGRGHTDNPQLDELLRAVDYVPLAVTLMARLGQIDSTTVLLERWTAEKTRLLSRPQDKHRLKSVDISIGMSIRSHRMQSHPDALRLLSAISVLPSGVFDGNLPDICWSIENLDEASATLREVALAYHDASCTLRVLSPIRLYILKYHTANQDQLQNIQSFYFSLVEKGMSTPGDLGYKETLDTLLTHGENIEAVITGALMESMETGKDEGDKVVQAALDWTTFLSSTHPRKTIIELAVQFVQQQAAHPKLCECLRRLGDIQCRLSEYNAAQMNLTAALEISEMGNDRGEMAQCLYTLGRLQRYTGKERTAMETFLKARQTFEVVGDQCQIPWCIYHIGDLQCRQDETDTGQVSLIEAQQAFNTLNNQHGAAACLLALGDSQRRTHAYDASRGSLTKARLAFESLDDRHGVALCFVNFGVLHNGLHEYDAAQKMFIEARQLFKALNDQRMVADCLMHLGDVHTGMADYEAAHKFLLDARLAFETINHQKGVAKCLFSLGNVHQKTGRHNAACETILEARSIFEAVNDQHGAAACLLRLGRFQYQAGQYNTAQQYLTEALRAFEHLGNQESTTDCLLTLGELYISTVDYGGAWEMLLQAQKGVCQAFANQTRFSQCLWNLANEQRWKVAYETQQEILVKARTAYEVVNDRIMATYCLLSLSWLHYDMGQYEAAQEVLIDAKEEYEIQHAQRGIAHCYLLLAKIQMQTAAYDTARETLIDARRAYDDINDRPGVADCLHTLGELQTETGELDAAQETLSEARRIYEDVGDEDSAGSCFRSLEQIQGSKTRNIRWLPPLRERLKALMHNRMRGWMKE